MDMLSAAAGDNALTLNGEDWPTKTSEQSYQEYYTMLADSIPEGTFGSYDIQQIANDDGSYSINAVVFASLASDASIGSFSAVLLQSIAREITGSSELTISFTNNPLPPN